MDKMCHGVMVPIADAGTRRTRLSIDLPADLKRRIRMAAARRDQSIHDYVLVALRARLQEDLPGSPDGLLALDAASDPVLAELWDNPRDAIYD